MQDLIKHEQFEIEVLERLNSRRLLSDLIFIGGTMLRLCHGLSRYSVDLDFWFSKQTDEKAFFNRLRKGLEEDGYKIRDAALKFHTLLFEIKSERYPRALKIEIRKGDKKAETESVIAYSPNSSAQVILQSLSLPEMASAKVAAFLDRKEIRDIFDLEFMIKKGIEIKAPKEDLILLLKGIDALTKNDYRLKLAPLLSPVERKYYLEKNFSILKSALREMVVE